MKGDNIIKDYIQYFHSDYPNGCEIKENPNISYKDNYLNLDVIELYDEDNNLCEIFKDLLREKNITLLQEGTKDEIISTFNIPMGISIKRLFPFQSTIAIKITELTAECYIVLTDKVRKKLYEFCKYKNK